MRISDWSSDVCSSDLDAPYRMTPEDVLALKVRNASGEMVPFSSFTQVEWTSGPQQLQRYNGYPAMTISGMAAPGRSTGEAMDEMERLATALPEGFAYRSEEHTSELQSLMRISYAVFCFKKKKTKHNNQQK